MPFTKVSLEELKILGEVQNLSFAKNLKSLQNTTYKLTLSSPQQLFNLHPDWDFYKLCFNNSIIGGAYIRKLNNFTCEIYRLFVLPSFCNQGFGSFIINRIIDVYKECTSFVLETPTHLTHNISFYEKNHFNCVEYLTDKGVQLVKMKRTVMRSAVTGITPSYNGLHLGHYNGNILPILSNQDNYNCHFILADWQVLNSNIQYYNNDILKANMELMVKQLLALGVCPEKVKIVQESKIKNNMFSDFIYLTDFIAHNRIARLPLIKNNNSNIKMSLFTYPLLQALDLIATNSEIVFSNNDNRPCIELINELFRKINKTGIKKYKCVKFITGKTNYLSGTDGKKMSKSKNNCILFTDSLDTLKNKINLLPSNEDIKNSTVFNYLQTFTCANEYQEYENLYKTNNIKDQELKNIIYNKLKDLFLLYQERFEKISDNLVKDIVNS